MAAEILVSSAPVSLAVFERDGARPVGEGKGGADLTVGLVMGTAGKVGLRVGLGGLAMGGSGGFEATVGDAVADLGPSPSSGPCEDAALSV